MKKLKAKSSSKTLNNNNEVVLTLTFSNIKDAKQFVEIDAFETYLHIISKKWSSLTPREQKQVQNIDNYVNNTNFVVSLIYQTYIDAINYLINNNVYGRAEAKDKLDKWKTICRTINKKSML